MTHNDVDRRTAPELPARTLTSHTLTPRTLGGGTGHRTVGEPWLRPLVRPLVRQLHRSCEGGR
ncbi:hypothetical protein [Kitasatospora sp. NPDC057223]|jgi:hypothetical protein|uniref:hypothetical protein n=1 Tax=Kitasatospora sp. NPDC057223 TaxID=3346055 RepID=UPI00362A7D04